MTIRLEPWSEPDLELLRQINTPEMKQHLGGPETDEQVLARHKRYLAGQPGVVQMYRVVLLPEEVAVGSIGFWEREWEGDQVYETGWSTLPGYQGRGIAVAAAQAVIDVIRGLRRHRHLLAYPGVDNPASNAICRKAGFVLIGPSEFEYPPGHMMMCNVWSYELYPEMKPAAK